MYEQCSERNKNLSDLFSPPSESRFVVIVTTFQATMVVASVSLPVSPTPVKATAAMPSLNNDHDDYDGSPSHHRHSNSASGSNSFLSLSPWRLTQVRHIALSFGLYWCGMHGIKAWLSPSEERIDAIPLPLQTVTVRNKDTVTILDFRYNEPLIEPALVTSRALFRTTVYAPVWVMVLWLLWRTVLTRQPLHHQKHQHRTLCFFVSTVGLLEVLCKTLKYSVLRFRPNFFALCDYNGVGKTIGDGCNAPTHRVVEGLVSFPSGHASLSFATTTCLVWLLYRRGYRWICWTPWLYALVASVSRIMDHWHHPSDIIAGGLLGMVVSTIVYTAVFVEAVPPCRLRMV